MPKKIISKIKLKEIIEKQREFKARNEKITAARRNLADDSNSDHHWEES